MRTVFNKLLIFYKNIILSNGNFLERNVIKRDDGFVALPAAPAGARATYDISMSENFMVAEGFILR